MSKRGTQRETENPAPATEHRCRLSLSLHDDTASHLSPLNPGALEDIGSAHASATRLAGDPALVRTAVQTAAPRRDKARISSAHSLSCIRCGQKLQT